MLAILKNLKKRREEKREKKIQENRDGLAKRTRIRRGIEKLAREIPIYEGVDLVNYCAMRRTSPGDYQLIPIETSFFRSFMYSINVEREIGVYLSEKDYFMYKSRLTAKERGFEAIILAEVKEKRFNTGLFNAASNEVEYSLKGQGVKRKNG